MIKKDFKLGVSIAASWAWGTSLILGMQISQEKGFIPFLIWAIANSLTLAIFGELNRRNIITRDTYNKKAIKGLAVVIQMFCLIIQLNIINTTLLSLGLGTKSSYITVAVIGIIFVTAMYRKGLKTSIFTDKIQWFIAMGIMLLMLAIGMLSNVEHNVIMQGDISGIKWAVWSACILIAAPFGDIQHWQRADLNGKGSAFSIGACLFAFYMVLVFILSLFQFNTAMNILLLISVLCVTTSTIDSIAVAMHEMVNKKVGTIVSVAFCLLWGVFAEIGVLELWSKFGVYRVGFAVVVVSVALSLKYKKSGAVEQ